MAEIETHRKNQIKFRLALRDNPELVQPGKNRRLKVPCFWCGQVFSLKNLTLDRLIPKSLGGTNGQTNLALACEKCNNRRDHLAPGVMLRALRKLEENNLRRPWVHGKSHEQELALASHIRNEHGDLLLQCGPCLDTGFPF